MDMDALAFTTHRFDAAPDAAVAVYCEWAGQADGALVRRILTAIAPGLQAGGLDRAQVARGGGRRSRKARIDVARLAATLDEEPGVYSISLSGDGARGNANLLCGRRPTSSLPPVDRRARRLDQLACDFGIDRIGHPVMLEADVERHLVPALGAYLGELLVLELGGLWAVPPELDLERDPAVPADWPVSRVEPADCDRIAVVIGETAWFPFAGRAGSSMRPPGRVSIPRSIPSWRGRS